MFCYSIFAIYSIEQTPAANMGSYLLHCVLYADDCPGIMFHGVIDKSFCRDWIFGITYAGQLVVVLHVHSEEWKIL